MTFCTFLLITSFLILSITIIIIAKRLKDYLSVISFTLKSSLFLWMLFNLEHFSNVKILLEILFLFYILDLLMYFYKSLIAKERILLRNLQYKNLMELISSTRLLF